MKRLSFGASLAVSLAVAGSASVAHADPPSPPSTPVCKWCSGPPPAPTPVPTLAPTLVVPDTRPVVVEIAPTKVHRGGQTQVTVTGATDVHLTMVVRYSHGKPATYRASLGHSGKYQKKWKVSKSAPLGKASVKVTLAGAEKPYTAVVSFTVVK